MSWLDGIKDAETTCLVSYLFGNSQRVSEFRSYRTPPPKRHFLYSTLIALTTASALTYVLQCDLTTVDMYVLRICFLPPYCLWSTSNLVDPRSFVKTRYDEFVRKQTKENKANKIKREREIERKGGGGVSEKDRRSS